MPPKNKKSPATRPLSVLQQKNKILNSGKKKPAWDDSVNDLTAFRATKDDLLRRKILHQSANTDLVKEDFLQKKIMQVIKKNSLASKGVFKEVIQNEGDDSITKRSSSTNSHDSFYNSQIKQNKNQTNYPSKEIIGKENRQTSSAKSEKVKAKLPTDNDMHYPVRILNDYKHDDEGEWEQVDDDDDHDDHSPISSKSYLSSSKKNMDAGNESICLKQLLVAVSLMSDHFEEISDRLNVETERRREAETNLNILSSSCQQMEKEIASLRDEVSSLRKGTEIHLVNGNENICSVSKALHVVNGSMWRRDLYGQPKHDDDDNVGGDDLSSTHDPPINSVANEQNAKNTFQKLAIPLIAPKQINSPLFPNHLKFSQSECDNSKDKLKQQQLAELSRRKDEKLKELNRILLMEKTAQGSML